MKSELLIRPVEFKQFDEEFNTIEGYASVFDIVDSQDDVIVQGAFKKTIKERVPAGLVKFLSSHQWSVESVLGTVVEAKEDDHGLWFKAQLSAAPAVQETRVKMLEGHINRLSIGFRTIKDHYDRSEDNGNPSIRYIDEVKLYEVSAVPFAANEEAVITSVKAGALIDLAMAGEINKEEIKIAIDRLLDLVGDAREDILKSLIAEPESGASPLTDEDDDVQGLELLQLETRLELNGVIP